MFTLTGEAYGANGGYSDSLAGDLCYQLVMSKGKATGRLTTKVCDVESSALCSHPVKGIRYILFTYVYFKLNKKYIKNSTP